MLSHRVSEYFGDVIEVEMYKTATPFNATHYGDLPWTSETPKFATRLEKFKIMSENRSAKRTEQNPAYCISVQHKRFFIIEKFKQVHSAPTDDKPKKERK